MIGTDALLQAADVIKSQNFPRGKQLVWRREENVLLIGFYHSRLVKHLRLFPPLAEASKYGISPLDLFFNDATKVFNCMKEAYLDDKNARKPSALKRRFKELRQKNKKQDKKLFEELLAIWKDEFKGLKLIGSPLFEDGVHEKSDDELKQIILSSGDFKLTVNNTKMESLLSPDRCTAWRLEEEILLIGHVTERFRATGSLFPEKSSEKDEVWNTIGAKFKISIGRLQKIMSFSVERREARALHRHFKVIRTQIQQGLRSGVEDLYMLFLAINENGMFSSKIRVKDMLQECNRIAQIIRAFKEKAYAEIKDAK